MKSYHSSPYLLGLFLLALLPTSPAARAGSRQLGGGAATPPRERVLVHPAAGEGTQIRLEDGTSSAGSITEVAEDVLSPSLLERPRRGVETEPGKDPSPEGNDLLAEPDPVPSAVQTVLYEDFEGIFPSGLWDVFDQDGATNGHIYWDDTSYRRDAGSWSAWCADGGPDARPAGSNYINDMRTWMIYGPFDLSDAVAATFSFRYWSKTEYGFDYFKYFASTNGTNFYGYQTTGDSGGWVSGSIDLTNVPTLGNVTGQSQVWIAFLFTSDFSITEEGSYVDEVRVEKTTAVGTDLLATEVFFRDQPGNTGNRVDNPTPGQQLYPYFRFTVAGTQAVTGRIWTLRLPSSGTTLCSSTGTLDPGAWIGWCTGAWTATSGSHTLQGTLDPDGTIAETNENNNVASRNYSIGTSVDLVATEVYFRDQPSQGGSVVDNPTPGQPVYPHFRFSVVGGTVSGIVASLDLPLSSTPLCDFNTTLEPGNYVGSCGQAWVATAGAHNLRGRVDPNGTIAESSEANNSVIRAYTVGNTPPDIRIQPLSLTFAAPAPIQEARRVGAAQAPPEEFSQYARLQEKAKERGRVRVLVGLNVPFAPEGRLSQVGVENQRQAIAAAQTSLLQRLDGADALVTARFSFIPHLAFEVDDAALERLRAAPEVLSIVEDEVLRTNLASSAPVVGAPAAWAAGFTGAGHTVAILDTGVDKAHPFFSTGGNKVVSEACYSTTSAASDSVSVCPGGVSQSTAPGSGEDCSISGCDHGTHVAGIAAGDDGVGPNIGIGRGASLIAVQVFSRFNSGCSSSPPCVAAFTTDIVKGLERVYALRNTFNIASVNMSLGGGNSTVNCDASNSTTKAAIDNLRSFGIATVIASGNSGARNAVSSPGCISTAVSVGATDDLDNVASFSNVASFLSLLAPGVSINSSIPGGGIGSKNGTSMATPHVAGAWAILKQAAPNASVDAILAALRDTGTLVNDNRSGGTVTGMRRINVDAALNGLGGGQSFTVFNDGGSTLNVTSMALQTSGPWIAWSPAAPFSVAAGGSRNVTVSVDFNSAPSGSSTRRLLVQSNDPDENPYPGGVDIVVNNGSNCFALTRARTGNGSNPTVSPTSSSGCGPGQYHAGEVVQLTASPAAGWMVSGWSGTDNDASQALINFVTMPSTNRTVTVHYVQSSPTCHFLSVSHTGTGGDPVRSPANSTGCPASTYVTGASVQLTASPTPGWSVGSWSGTINDASQSTVNTVTMPAGPHSAAVHYTASCFTLALTHSGSGANPIASPNSSSGCGAGKYLAGAVIALDASPGAGAGWTIGQCCNSGCGGWSGTDDDSSRSEVNQVTMPAANRTVSVIYTQQCAAPVYIDLIDFQAVSDGEGVEIRWETGFEMDNLGFYLHREDSSGTRRITPGLVAGSALLTDSVLSQGYSYTWRDESGGTDSLYWLEDVDLDGSRTRYGPFAVRGGTPADSRKGSLQRSTMLRQLAGDGLAPAVPLEPHATPPSAGPDRELRMDVQRWLAASSAVKVRVSHEGLYRIGGRELVAAGISPAAFAPGLRLLVDGAEVPMLVFGGEDGTLDEDDFLVFYGIGQDSPWSRQRTYWLIESERPGLRMETASAQGAGDLPSFQETLEWRPRTTYFASLLNGDEENFFGPAVGEEPVEARFDLPFLDPHSPRAGRLSVRLQGVLGTHDVSVEINGAVVGRLQYSGQSRGEAEFELPAGRLRRGANLVRLVATEGGEDVSLVDRLQLAYPRLPRTASDHLTMEIPESSRVAVRGFGGASLLTIDATDPDRPFLLETLLEPAVDGFVARFSAAREGERRVLISTLGALRAPDSLEADRPSDWSAEESGYEVVIITHSAAADPMARLRDFRQSQGRPTALVDVEDLYDEYAFGAPTPLAIRDFLRDAGSRRQVRPNFLLLAGDASLDPKNYLGRGRFDSVPTRMLASGYSEAASDDWFADLDGDGLADLAVGRLPVQGSLEAAVAVDKIIGYESRPPAGHWRSAVTLVSDRQSDFEFDAESRKLSALVPLGRNVLEISRGSADASSRLLRAIAGGQSVVGYLGHGSVQRWAGDLLDSDRAARLQNGDRLPFVFSMACLTGLFNGPGQSLAEALITAPEGGAVAVLASPSLDGARRQVDFAQAVLQTLFDNPALPLGEVVRLAKRASGKPESVFNYVFFGDPLTRLVEPNAAPPAGWRTR